MSPVGSTIHRKLADGHFTVVVHTEEVDAVVEVAQVDTCIAICLFLKQALTHGVVDFNRSQSPFNGQVVVGGIGIHLQGIFQFADTFKPSMEVNVIANNLVTISQNSVGIDGIHGAWIKIIDRCSESIAIERSNHTVYSRINQFSVLETDFINIPLEGSYKQGFMVTEDTGINRGHSCSIGVVNGDEVLGFFAKVTVTIDNHIVAGILDLIIAIAKVAADTVAIAVMYSKQIAIVGRNVLDILHIDIGSSANDMLVRSS